MPQLALLNIAGEKVGQVDADEAVFGAPRNADLIHQAIRAVDSQRTRKAGTAKTRGQLTMTTAKIYRQKGLGRARHGNRGAPLFVGGGVAHPPQGQGRVRKMPARARRAAMCSALSDMARRHKVIVLEALAFTEPRTKDALELLSALHVHGKVLLLASSDEARSEANYKSFRNLQGVVLRETPHINTRDVLWADYLVLTQGGLQGLIEGGAENA